MKRLLTIGFCLAAGPLSAGDAATDQEAGAARLEALAAPQAEAMEAATTPLETGATDVTGTVARPFPGRDDAPTPPPPDAGADAQPGRSAAAGANTRDIPRLGGGLSIADRAAQLRETDAWRAALPPALEDHPGEDSTSAPLPGGLSDPVRRAFGFGATDPAAPQQKPDEQPRANPFLRGTPAIQPASTRPATTTGATPDLQLPVNVIVPETPLEPGSATQSPPPATHPKVELPSQRYRK